MYLKVKCHIYAYANVIYINIHIFIMLHIFIFTWISIELHHPIPQYCCDKENMFSIPDNALHLIWCVICNYSRCIVDLRIIWRKMKYWPILNLLNLEWRVCLGGGEIWIQIRCQHHKVKCWATTSYLCPKSKSLKKLKTLLTSSLDPIHRQSSHRRPSCYPKCWQEDGLGTTLWKIETHLVLLLRV